MKKFWRNNRGIIVFLGLMLFFRSAIADWYQVPSSSMEPNVLIGDRVWVNKLAYDVKVPFTDINLNRHDEPKAGDVIVFQSEVGGERFIKRVIGVPGDSISMIRNQLFVNGKPLPLEYLETEQSFDVFLNDRDKAVYLKETLASNQDKVYPIRLSSKRMSSRSSFSEKIIPEDTYWVLGDNRDNSSDSRWIGFVPRHELVGRAESVIISLDSNNYYLPREGRYLEEL